MTQSHSLQHLAIIAILIWLNPTMISVAEDGPQAPRPAACSADGALYACATPCGRIKLSRTTDGVAQRTFYLCGPESLALSPDARFLAAVGKHDGCSSELKVWNTADGSLVCRIDTDFGAESLLFSNDGAFLVGTTSGSTIELWNVRSSATEWSKTLDSRIFYLCFHSQALVALCEDGRTRRFPLH